MPRGYGSTRSRSSKLVHMTDELEPYPEAELRDYARAGVQAGIAAIPVVGGPIQTLAEVVIAPSLTKRRENWMRKLQDLMEELRRKSDNFDPASLAGNEVFVTAVADASRIAMGTHLEEKLEMLKNCLAHMATGGVRDDFLDLQFFRYVDDLSPEHFLVLQYLSNPAAWFDRRKIPRPTLAMGSPWHLMVAAGMPLVGAALEIVLRDLSDRGLANTQSLKTTMTGEGAWQSLATDVGRQLLDFVSSI